MSTGKVTTDHKTIQRWTEKRGGKPARVKATADRSGRGLLRIDFPDRDRDDHLEEISWQDFFATFEERDLAFLYQEETADGHESRFSRFVERSSVEARPAQGSDPGKAAAPRTHSATGKGHDKPHAKA